MRVLVVSFRFPPAASMGAVRVARTAAALASRGHEVRVIAPEVSAADASLDLGIDEATVTRTRWLNVNRLPQSLIGGREEVVAHGYPRARPVVGRLGALYKSAINIPDGQIGWVPFAVSRGRQVTAAFTPDVILAGSGPPSTLIAGALLSRLSGVPWVADMRDLWADNPYYDLGRRRQRIDEMLERRTLAEASALITVSDTWADSLRRKYPSRVEVIRNGFDPEDAVAQVPRETASDVAASGLLLRHMGSTYMGRRDPEPLLRAMRSLHAEGQRVRLEMYGAREPALDDRLAQQFGDVDCVSLPAVSRTESLRLQADADALVLLTWDDARELGVLPGKLFEYAGTGRPILVVGRPDTAAARLVSSTGVGVVASDESAIRAVLSGWLQDKQGSGRVAAPDPEGWRLLAREPQIDLLEALLLDVAAVGCR